jgi:hypothetical protein
MNKSYYKYWIIKENALNCNTNNYEQLEIAIKNKLIFTATYRFIVSDFNLFILSNKFINKKFEISEEFLIKATPAMVVAARLRGEI